MADTGWVLSHPVSVWICRLLIRIWYHEAKTQTGKTEEEARTKVLPKLALATTAAIGFLAWPVIGQAASTGYAIEPFSQDVTLPVGQPTARYSVTLINDTAMSQSFNLTTEDFGTLNNSGGVAFLGSSSNSFSQKYGLSQWMTLDESSVTLAPGGSTSIWVTINNSSSLAPGGHYGAILATAQTAPSGKTASRVGVLEVLSSLLLVDKAGGPPPDLEMVGQTLSDHNFEMPKTVTHNFDNIGDVHVVPKGTVAVRDPFGKEVESGALNVNSGAILPGTYRVYTTPLMSLTRAWWPGPYSVTTTYSYEGGKVTKTFSTSFWYIGSYLAWATGALVLAALVGLLWLGRVIARRLRKS